MVAYILRSASGKRVDHSEMAGEKELGNMNQNKLLNSAYTGRKTLIF